MTDDGVAAAYSRDVHAAERAGVDAEPEAQLTTPVKQLFERVAEREGLPRLDLLREAQLPGIRPDFSSLVGGRAGGWVELKEPAKTVDGRRWTGREKRQWEGLAELDTLIVCNGREAQLFGLGEPDGDPAKLPYDGGGGWDPAPLTGLLRRFVESQPRSVRRVSDLALRLAPLTRLLRERLRAALETSPPAEAAVDARTAWAQHVHEGVDNAAFCDDLAQVIGYSFAIAGLRGDADTDHDGVIRLAEAQTALRGSSAVLAAALGPVIGVPGLLDLVASELGAIERLVSAIDLERISRHQDPRGEPWLWFYEDFLDAYDSQARKQAGVYYTPTAVVSCQIRLVDHIVREHLGRRLGYGDKDVVFLDPACGSGTYPLAAIDQAAETATAERGPGGPAQIAARLADNLIGFELLPGPYAVAQLRIGQRLHDLGPGSPAPNVFLTDTLEPPDSESLTPGLFGDPLVLAQERQRARQIKRERRVMVVMGNPPYDRVSREAAGGWVVHGPRDPRPLFEDVLEPARRRTIFSHHASLYNLYVYFWCWALWKAFEAHGDGPSVVSFISASSWLSGPGFVGLRELARRHGDDIWIVDLGGDNKGAQPEQNVFNIETPVAIVTIVRHNASSTATLPRVCYRRIRGTRADKLAALDQVGPPDFGDHAQAWETLPDRAGDSPLVPPSGAAGWQDLPALIDLFPWQQPGCKFNRTWPIAPDQQTLERRWSRFTATSVPEERAAAFSTAGSGRTIHTRVAGFSKLVDLGSGSPHQPIARYGFRSFDRQWAFDDPRLAKTDSPSLWHSRSERQLFLTTQATAQLGVGPALTVTTEVPDLHHFRGCYGGKDVLPLWRDAAAATPNLAPGLLGTLTAAHRHVDADAAEITPERFVAYVYALLSTPAYQQRFAEELRTPGPRVPITADPALFAEAADLGERLLWLHTSAERFTDQTVGRGPYVPAVSGLEWRIAVARLPATTADVGYDAAAGELIVGDGRISGVTQEVWDYEVSGMPVVKKWLGYRTASGSGRAVSSDSELDRIRPQQWADEWNDELLDLLRILTHTLDLRPQQDELLDRVCSGPLIPVSQLAVPGANDPLRKPPTPPRQDQHSIDDL